MQLPAGFREEPGEVPHPLEVAGPDGVRVEHDQPVVALRAEDVALGIRRLDGRWWRLRRRGLDAIEDRAGRLPLQGGPVLAAAGAVNRAPVP